MDFSILKPELHIGFDRTKHGYIYENFYVDLVNQSGKTVFNLVSVFDSECKLTHAPRNLPDALRKKWEGQMSREAYEHPAYFEINDSAEM